MKAGLLRNERRVRYMTLKSDGTERLWLSINQLAQSERRSDIRQSLDTFPNFRVYCERDSSH